jgi:hypothetical protein
MVKHFGWLDHNAPPMWLLVECVAAMHDWLSQHPSNVCAIHCLAGKGRTGTVVSSYLIHDRMADSPDQALQFFARQRYNKISHNKPMGVEVPSQVRAVHYYHKLISGGVRSDALAVPRRVRLKRVIMYPVPLLGVLKEGCQPLIEVYQNGQQPGAKPVYTTPFQNTYVTGIVRTAKLDSAYDVFGDFYSDPNSRQVTCVSRWISTCILKVMFNCVFTT